MKCHWLRWEKIDEDVIICGCFALGIELKNSMLYLLSVAYL